jgi:DUF438 domain-containing protein
VNITTQTTIHDLVDAYPYLLDWLVSYNSHFEALKNPALFNTMARVAKVESAAQMASVDAGTLLDDIRTEVAKHEIIAEESAGGPVEPGDPQAAMARQEALKSIIRKLHDGMPVDQVKAEFDALIVGVSSAEIARMEQALISEGMPVEDVQRLCDVHVTVFKESLDEKPSAAVAAGHPVDAYLRENAVATQLVTDANFALGELATAVTAEERAAALETVSARLGDLAAIDTHYTRKENQLFPVLETHGVEGPTKVMWGLDDDIRQRIKTARSLVAAGDTASLAATLPETLTMVDDMIYKEEKILFPTALDIVTSEEWDLIAEGDAEIGYAWIEGPGGEAPVSATPASEAAGSAEGGEMLLPLPTGALTLAQLDLLFRALPFDVTYVDENDRVRFYSEGERVFPRSPGAIGREVRNCHPPKSLHKVEEILAAFKAGTKDVAEFWIEMGPKFVHIRYFALRDAERTYKGCLEVVQDATHVRSLTGNRRIVDW